MLASVFNSPTNQHLLYTNNNHKLYAVHHDLKQTPILQSIIPPLKGNSKDGGRQISARSPRQVHKSSSQIIDEFLGSSKKHKKHKIRSKIAVVQQQRVGETSSTRLACKAYTLPHNVDTEVVEVMPSGDSPSNNYNDDLNDMSLEFRQDLLQDPSHTRLWDLLDNSQQRLDSIILISSHIYENLSSVILYISDIFENFLLRHYNNPLPRLRRTLIDKLRTFCQYILSINADLSCTGNITATKVLQPIRIWTQPFT
ncbi:uncharacterized protein LOC122322459 [Drosophila grimshawi]|uniref:uncharacterized protein LOC122322459 n=1 Tax=Drosophila grimshawi TaxID=7222 RepID=UPI001C9345A0|nr:uncharacterized protein LOC122322459 [Drosophila grimshawi]